MKRIIPRLIYFAALSALFAALFICFVNTMCRIVSAFAASEAIYRYDCCIDEAVSQGWFDKNKDVIAMNGREFPGYYTISRQSYESNINLTVLRPETIKRLLKENELKEAFDYFGITAIMGYDRELSQKISRATGAKIVAYINEDRHISNYAKRESEIDLLDEFENATKETPDPDAKYYYVKGAVVGGVWKNCVFAHAPTTFTYAIDLKQDPKLSFFIALRPIAWINPAWVLRADGVGFEVLVGTDGKSWERVYCKEIDPRHRADDRRWIEGSVDLYKFSNKRVMLRFKTLGLRNNMADFALWGEPVITFSDHE